LWGHVSKATSGNFHTIANGFRDRESPAGPAGCLVTDGEDLGTPLFTSIKVFGEVIVPCEITVLVWLHICSKASEELARVITEAGYSTATHEDVGSLLMVSTIDSAKTAAIRINSMV